LAPAVLTPTHSFPSPFTLLPGATPWPHRAPTLASRQKRA
jgi:hypothetical protein